MSPLYGSDQSCPRNSRFIASNVDDYKLHFTDYKQYFTVGVEYQ